MGVEWKWKKNVEHQERCVSAGLFVEMVFVQGEYNLLGTFQKWVCKLAHVRAVWFRVQQFLSTPFLFPLVVWVVLNVYGAEHSPPKAKAIVYLIRAKSLCRITTSNTFVCCQNVSSRHFPKINIPMYTNA